MAWFSGAIGDNDFRAPAPASDLNRGTEKGGMGGIESGVSLLHQIEAVPVSAEVLDLARGELEPGAELAVLEEDVGVPEAGCVEVLPLPLLGEDALDALDESDLLEDPDLPVACGDRDAVPLADLLALVFPLLVAEKVFGLDSVV